MRTLDFVVDWAPPAEPRAARGSVGLPRLAGRTWRERETGGSERGAASQRRTVGRTGSDAPRDAGRRRRWGLAHSDGKRCRAAVAHAPPPRANSCRSGVHPATSIPPILPGTTADQLG